MEELVDAIVAESGVSYSPILSLGDCYTSFRDAVGKYWPHKESTQIIQPAGGVFYYQHAPVFFLHVVDLTDVSDGEEEVVAAHEEASYFAECAMLCRAAEMYFAGQDIYPVLLAVQGGSATFWKYMEILQFGQTTRRNIAKIYGHCIPIVISYTCADDIIVVAKTMVEDAKRSLIVPAAER
jgi:hypothetical protein